MHRKQLILILINTLAHAAEIAWQSSCCGTGHSFPKNWTDTSCWSTRSTPAVNDRARLQFNIKCVIRLNTDDSISIGELSVANGVGFDLQLIGPVGGSKFNFTVGTVAVTSPSVLTVQDLNVIFRGSSTLNGKLNMKDCRATGPGSITVNGELALSRSPPFTLEFHVPDVTIAYYGVLKITSNILLSSSRIRNSGRMEVDVLKITELRGAVAKES
jgi:hypothetical protein